MRTAAYAAGLCLLALGCAPTRADFIVTGYGYPGPVEDVYEFYALDNGTNGTGTRVEATDVIVINSTYLGGIVFGYGLVFRFVDSTPLADADVTGVALYHASADNPAVLFNGHSDRTFVNILGDESAADPTLYHGTLTNPDRRSPTYHGIPIYTFEQVGNVPGGVDASAAVNGGRGALIAVAVVQHGDPVYAAGTVSGLIGPSNGFLVIAPEPSGAALLAVGLGALLVRRRQRTA